MTAALDQTERVPRQRGAHLGDDAVISEEVIVIIKKDKAQKCVHPPGARADGDGAGRRESPESLCPLGGFLSFPWWVLFGGC